MELTLTADEFRARIADLSVWERDGERAPHKPLLLLWALGRVQSGAPRLAPYGEVHRAIASLLKEFGRPGQVRPNYPVWYLRNDGVWEVTGEAALYTVVREGRANEPSPKAFREAGSEAGFTEDVWHLLQGSPELAHESASLLLDAHFPESYHRDILDAVGLVRWDVVRRLRRDPAFRDSVLAAYGWQCAVCGFDARLGQEPIALEAAHIKWHRAGGPDAVANGLAMCALHHTVFDRGAIHVTRGGEILVSSHVSGGVSTDAWLKTFHGRRARRPLASADRPSDDFLAWHHREVWRG